MQPSGELDFDEHDLCPFAGLDVVTFSIDIGGTARYTWQAADHSAPFRPLLRTRTAASIQDSNSIVAQPHNPNAREVLKRPDPLSLGGM